MIYSFDRSSWMMRSSRSCRALRRKQRRRRPSLEVLEEHVLLTSFIVTNTLDNGSNTDPTPGSLRQAIIDANNDPVVIDAPPDIISFNLANPPTIATINLVDMPLPAVTRPGVEIIGEGPGTQVAAPGQEGVSGVTVNGARSQGSTPTTTGSPS